MELAMFPLEAALLPNQDLPLRIFEPRYVALVRHCVDTGEPFGVVLIARGREVGGGDARCDVGVLCTIEECVEQGAERYAVVCRTGERIRVSEWLADDPYPRASVQPWPDEPGDAVTVAQLVDIEDRMMALFERIAEARDTMLPYREVLLGPDDADAGQRLYTLATRIPIGAADRYAVLAAPSAADRLAALSEAVDAIAEMVEFQLSE
ncbi:MAG: LON peptidase substrate-binding domain-containing protein [Actinomycetota bacterium]|uniref:LON peptidase substrate-binding domain-containing protein n=1 Tax=Mycobacterium lentiflavum TaxID=141349 RepID=A0ABY3UU06_MYCLN|nr:LON peptidase substrate-binding domain-containing protein [Mycobacterium lentiflavum]MEE3067023.1 LON peptidase substrate-binding domain-containing protein [Actinomycetota bacterium]ULP43071.1 LON peptidase substrate-binding domain-containing protein [Mycobacterium lentiflavum]